MSAQRLRQRRRIRPTARLYRNLLGAELAGLACIWAAPCTAAGAEAGGKPAEPESGPPEQGANQGGATDHEEKEDAFLAATVNVAGFALFGPDLNVEAGGRFTGLVRLRGFGLGYLSHAMFAPDENRGLSLGSLSLGAGGRAYFSEAHGSFAGPYAGISAEYLSVFIDETDPFGTMETTTTFLIPAVEGGYRFVLGSVLLGGGAGVGYAFGLSGDCTYTAGKCSVEPRKDSVYGEVRADVGVTF